MNRRSRLRIKKIMAGAASISALSLMKLQAERTFYLVKEVVDETTRVFEEEEPADAEADGGRRSPKDLEQKEEIVAMKRR